MRYWLTTASGMTEKRTTVFGHDRTCSHGTKLHLSTRHNLGAVVDFTQQDSRIGATLTFLPSVDIPRPRLDIAARADLVKLGHDSPFIKRESFKTAQRPRVIHFISALPPIQYHQKLHRPKVYEPNGEGSLLVPWSMKIKRIRLQIWVIHRHVERFFMGRR